MTEDSEDLSEFIRKETGLYISAGKEYHNGDGFLRMNLACPGTRLEEGLKRLKAGIEAYRGSI